MAPEHKQRIQDINRVAAKLSPGRYRMKTFMWQLTVRTAKMVKRVFDFLVSLALLILLAPIFLLTAIAIYLESPGPVFYRQVRVGENGSLFDFYKFRSMIVGADKKKQQLSAMNESDDGVIFKMKKDPRVTVVGRFIRKYSIDELPQLFNVLLGDMSLVGPRPALPEEVAQYTLDQRKRLHALPGITCIWQVSGRSEIPFTGQVELDVEYIRSTGVLNDLRILLKTIPAVLSGKGAY